MSAGAARRGPHDRAPGHDPARPRRPSAGRVQRCGLPRGGCSLDSSRGARDPDLLART